MARQLFTNNASSQLSGTLPQGGTTLVCAAGEGSRFPTPSGGDFFYLTCFTKDAYTNEQTIEVVKVTARAGDVMTVVRDIEGMTGEVGGFAYNGTATTVYLEMRWTAGCVDNMAQKGEIAPVATSGSYSDLDDLPTLGTVAVLDVAISGDAAAGEVVKGNDSRLTNARPASDVSAWAKAGTKPSYTKTEVGLGQVDNTSDLTKPVSTAQQTALDLKANLASPTLTGVPLAPTAAVNTNTTQIATTAFVQAEIAADAAPIAHVGSTGTSHGNVVAAGASGFMTGADKTKLDGIATGANNYTHPANHPASVITQDASNRFVTDAEKTSWNAKQTVLVSGTNIKTINGASLLGSGDVVAGDVTLTGTQTLTNKTITETVYALTGTTPALSATNGAIQTWTLSGNSTPTDSLSSGQSIILMILDGTAYSITWPSVVWTKAGGSGAAPTLNATVKTCVVLWKVGSTLYGSYLGDA